MVGAMARCSIASDLLCLSPFGLALFAHYGTSEAPLPVNKSKTAVSSPPPGLNEVQGISLQNLQFEVLKLTIDSPWLLSVGIGFVALVTTGSKVWLGSSA